MVGICRLGVIWVVFEDDLNPHQKGFCSRRAYLHLLGALGRSSSFKKMRLDCKLGFADVELLTENVKPPKSPLTSPPAVPNPPG